MQLGPHPYSNMADWLDVQEGTNPVRISPPSDGLRWALRETARDVSKKHICIDASNEESYFVRGVVAKRFASYLPGDGDLRGFLEDVGHDQICSRLDTLMMSGRFGVYALNEADLISVSKAVFARLPDSKSRELVLMQLVDLVALL